MVSVNEYADMAPEIERRIVSLINLPSIIAREILSIYPKARIELEELAAAGNIGLVRAGMTFREDCGCSFAHYAGLWIRRFELARLSDTYLIRLSRRDRKIAAEKPQGKYDPSLSWIELDAADDKDGCPTMQIAAEDEEERARELEEREIRELREVLLYRAIDVLPASEQRVIRAHLGVGYDAPMTWAEVARVLGINERTLYRTKDRALAHLSLILHRLEEEVLSSADPDALLEA